MDTEPRPRIVNGKIVKGPAAASAPRATGDATLPNTTGLTWAPSPPVIRRRAADDATVAAVAPPSPPPPARWGGGGGGSGGGGGGYEGGEEARYGAPAPAAAAAPPPADDGYGAYGGSAAPAPARATGIPHSSNAFARGANQNCGVRLRRAGGEGGAPRHFTLAPPRPQNVLTDRPTSRVLAPPGGRSSISIG